MLQKVQAPRQRAPILTEAQWLNETLGKKMAFALSGKLTWLQSSSYGKEIERISISAFLKLNDWKHYGMPLNL